MSNIDDTVAEVLRLDAQATRGPWDYWFEVGTRLGPDREHPIALVKQMRHARCPGGAGVDADAALITYYRTAAPALAREVQRLQAEIQPRIDRSIAFQEALEEAEAERDVAQARTWAARWKAVAHRYRSRSRKAGEHNAYSLLRRVQAENEVARLQNALDSANERCNRIQADGNALADQLHAWRQACQDHGIQPTPEALRAVLRRVDAACVAGADL